MHGVGIAAAVLGGRSLDALKRSGHIAGSPGRSHSGCSLVREVWPINVEINKYRLQKWSENEE